MIAILTIALACALWTIWCALVRIRELEIKLHLSETDSLAIAEDVEMVRIEVGNLKKQMEERQ